MKVPRLISLFRSLQEEEVKKFGQFLKSPYYNATPKMKALYKYLKITHPECQFEQEDKEYLFSKIFSKEPYSNRKMNNLTAALSSILQDFLLLQRNKSGTFVRDFSLYHVYRDRKLNSLSEKQLLKLQKTINARKGDTMVDHYYQLRIHHELYFHPNTSRLKGKQAQDYLNTTFKYLDLFYVQARLLHLCEMNFRENLAVANKSLEKDKIGKLKALIPIDKTPLLDIYMLLYQIQIEPDSKMYFDLREKVFDYILKSESRDSVHLLTFLNNYQVQRGKQGSPDFLSEVFSIYKFRLERNIDIQEDGSIDFWHFINICVTASELKEIVWLEHFIKHWQKKIREDVRENVVNLCKGYSSFAKEEYTDVILFASKVKRNIPNFGLPCWTLEVRAYYKMQENHDYLDNILRNFSNYLHRNQDSIFETTRIANRNFITLIRQLYRAKYDAKYTKKRLKDNMKSMTNIVCRSWLEKEINSLTK